MHSFKREHLEAAYRYIETLSPEMIAFEFMRRSSEYCEDYAAAGAGRGSVRLAAGPAPRSLQRRSPRGIRRCAA